MHTPITHRTVSMRLLLAVILIGVLGLIRPGAAATMSASSRDHLGDRPTVVLVHGSFADASGFNDVIQRLHARGYPTIAPSNPLRGLVSDAAYVRSVLEQPSGAPAWTTIPSWFVIGTGDNTIPPELHRFMAERADAVRTVELSASHVVMMSKPAAVVRVIVEAAQH